MGQRFGQYSYLRAFPTPGEESEASGLRFGSLMSQLEGGGCRSVVKIPAIGPVQQSQPGARPGVFGRVICISRLAGNPNGRKRTGIFRASTKCHAQCRML